MLCFDLNSIYCVLQEFQQSWQMSLNTRYKDIFQRKIQQILAKYLQNFNKIVSKYLQNVYTILTKYCQNIVYFKNFSKVGEFLSIPFDGGM